ncbi:hypothetical protein [Bosea sp. BIWAKO-01]|nr:hypothetical protein [Bosea sp. BIWAKO-01]
MNRPVTIALAIVLASLIVSPPQTIGRRLDEAIRNSRKVIDPMPG